MPAARVARVLAPVTLVLGGARSGKSRYAERLVEARGDVRHLLRHRRAGRCRDGGAHRRASRAARPVLADRRGAAGSGRRDRGGGRPRPPGAGRLPDLVAVEPDARRARGSTRRSRRCARRCATPPGRSCWSPTRSGSASCRKRRSAAGSATRPGGSTRRSPRSPTGSSSSPPGCRWC